MAKTTLTIEVEYDDRKTGPSEIAVRFDKIIEKAMGGLDEGNRGKVKLSPEGFMGPINPQPNDVIDEWLDLGAFEVEPVNVRELMQDAGRLLDKACSGEILQSPYFKIGGQWYTLSVEAYLLEADPDAIEELQVQLRDK